jgi:Aminotransferase class-V
MGPLASPRARLWRHGRGGLSAGSPGRRGGATAAVSKLIGILELRIPAGLDERYQLSARIPEPERPVVFVAGILTGTSAIARLLHAHGALSFWDYAAAGPYVPVRVAASAPGMRDHKDAVFLSPHKFPGGPQTPGVLVVRRELVRNAVPTVPGGGERAVPAPQFRRRAAERPVRHPGPRWLLVRGTVRPPAAGDRRCPVACAARGNRPWLRGVKPGWTRVNLNYFISPAAADYIADAVDLLAAEGYRLLPRSSCRRRPRRPRQPSSAPPSS